MSTSATSVIPRVLTESEIIISPKSKCGENWFRSVRISSIDGEATDTLPSLGDCSQIESYDPDFTQEIRGDVVRLRKFMSPPNSSLSERQAKNIEVMLERVQTYIDDAERILRFWESGFATTVLGKVPAWPLGSLPRSGVNDAIEEGHMRDSEKYKKLINAALKNLRCSEEVARRAKLNFRHRFKVSISELEKGHAPRHSTGHITDDLYMGEIEL
jgi:hypothetical protein